MHRINGWIASCVNPTLLAHYLLPLFSSCTLIDPPGTYRGACTVQLLNSTGAVGLLLPTQKT